MSFPKQLQRPLASSFSAVLAPSRRIEAIESEGCSHLIAFCGVCARRARQTRQRSLVWTAKAPQCAVPRDKIDAAMTWKAQARH